MGDISAPTIPPYTFTNTISPKSSANESLHHGINPIDGSQLWDVPIATEADLDQAVKSAREAFQTWRKKSWKERQAVLKAMKEELYKNKEDMTRIVALEGGKPPAVAAVEIYAAGECLEYNSTVAEPEPEVIKDDDALKVTLTWTPLGVTAAICPWNFPLILSVGKIAIALVTGNTCIVKPSPFTPYSILYFIAKVQHLLPPGVLQALNGDDKLGPQMTLHPGINKISFTGSIATGKRVMAAAASTLKRVTLELGGNSACIVCPDVDVTKVASLVATGAFYNSGQYCAASKRVYIHSDIYDEFKAALVGVVKNWKVNGGEGVMSPVQNKMQYQIVKGFFEDCKTNGYDFALGGEVSDRQGGYIIQPAIVDNPPEKSRIVKEEPFGPIVPLLRWSTEEDLLARVNDTNTGLGGAVYSVDLERANRIASQIEAGTIWINSSERILSSVYFSGHKESGMGGEYGTQGLYAYLNAQAVHCYKNDVGKGAKL